MANTATIAAAENTVEIPWRDGELLPPLGVLEAWRFLVPDRIHRIGRIRCALGFGMLYMVVQVVWHFKPYDLLATPVQMVKRRMMQCISDLSRRCLSLR